MVHNNITCSPIPLGHRYYSNKECILLNWLCTMSMLVALKPS